MTVKYFFQQRGRLEEKIKEVKNNEKEKCIPKNHFPDDGSVPFHGILFLGIGVYLQKEGWLNRLKKANFAAALLACSMVCSLSACMATTGKEIYQNKLLYSIDVAGMYAPEEAAAYRAENWEPSEKFLCDTLLKNGCERAAVAPGVSYTKAFPSGQIQECLNILDGGKEFYGKEAGRIGFQYFYNADEKMAEEMEKVENILTVYPRDQYLLENSDAGKSFSFASIDEELDKLDTLFQALGLGEMECSIAIAMNPESLHKIRAGLEQGEFGQEEYRFYEEGFYLFQFRRMVNETKSAWNENPFFGNIIPDGYDSFVGTDIITVITGRDGTISLEVYGFPKISDVIEEKSVVPAAEAIRAVEKICMEKLGGEVQKEVVSGEFCYVNVKDEKSFVKRLQPCWNFSVRITESFEDQNGEKREDVHYYAFFVNALNGKLIETDKELLSP